MHFSDIIGNQGSNNIWRYFWFLHWQNLSLQPLTTPLIFFFWSVNYANLVYKLVIMFWECQDTQILFILVYIGLNTFFSTEIYRISWVESATSTMFFPTCSRTEAKFIFDGLKYYASWKVHFQVSGTFITFCIWSVTSSRDFFNHFVSQ